MPTRRVSTVTCMSLQNPHRPPPALRPRMVYSPARVPTSGWGLLGARRTNGAAPSERSVRTEFVALMPRLEPLESGACGKHITVGMAPTDDLHPYRQVALGNPCRDGGSRMPREVHEVGQAPSDKGVYRFAVYLIGPVVFPSSAFSTGRQARVGVTSRSWSSKTPWIAS
jgi:hypothetical protein